MPKFGAGSIAHLNELHPDLQKVLLRAIQAVDFTITDGWRGEEAQNKAFKMGLSEKKWPESLHNNVSHQMPSTTGLPGGATATFPQSLAADIAPYPIDWSNTELARARFYYVQGVILMAAKIEGIKIRQGVDWNGNGTFTDQKFNDLPHVELVL